jgi:hypothetical protein
VSALAARSPDLLGRGERSSPCRMAARRRRGLDGEDADRAIINVTAVRVVVGHCPRGQVPDFTTSLALVLKKALEDRSAALGRSGSWPKIIADLDSLTETEIEHDGKRFVVRSTPRPAASLALRAAGVALPPTVRDAAAG